MKKQDENTYCKKNVTRIRERAVNQKSKPKRNKGQVKQKRERESLRPPLAAARALQPTPLAGRRTGPLPLRLHILCQTDVLYVPCSLVSPFFVVAWFARLKIPVYTHDGGDGDGQVSADFELTAPSLKTFCIYGGAPYRPQVLEQLTACCCSCCYCDRPCVFCWCCRRFLGFFCLG